MRALFHRLGRWAMIRLGIPALAVVLGVGVDAVRLARRDPVDFTAHRREQVARLGGEQARAEAALADVQSRLARLQADLATQEERRRTTERAIASLRAGDRWWTGAWDRLFGDAAEVRTREERLARLEQARTEAAARVAELRPAATRATWERDGVEIDLQRINRGLAALERDRSATLHYLTLAWRQTRWYVVAALLLWFLGPLAWRLARRRAASAGPPPAS